MMQTPYYIHYSPPRMMVHKMVTSKYFDLAISAVIGLNVITMAMEFYMMPRVSKQANKLCKEWPFGFFRLNWCNSIYQNFQELNYTLKVFNYFFTSVFILEAGMKISALGCGRYMSDRYNSKWYIIIFKHFSWFIFSN